MKYRLLALDLDGTLLGPDHTVSDANRRAVARAQAAEVLVVPCTGRGWRESLEPLQGVGGLELGVFNTGAAVVDMESGRPADTAEIQPELVHELIDHLRGLPEAVLVFQEHTQTGHDFLVTGDGVLTENTQRWFGMNNMLVREDRRPDLEALRHTLRVGVVATGGSAFEAESVVAQRFGDRINLHCFAGVPTTSKEDAVYILEIFAKGVDKWRGLAWIADQRGIGHDQVAVIGDEINDLAMLEHAGLGVAMDNAVPQAAELADRKTLSNERDGVAHAIDRMLAGEW